ncbi:tetratricopeptide repeat-containing protein [Cryptosporidium felis]|nr:tetratricopeptide repeat-containing protein [Cryptosporidium felis]
MEDEIMEGAAVGSDSEEQKENSESLFQSARELKETGNESFRNGDFTDARDKYEKGLEFLEKIEQGEDEFENEGFDELRQSLQLNLAMIYLKNQEWSKAINIAGEVLKKNSENIKALYRRGLGRLGFGMYEESKQDFQKVLKLDPTNIDAQKQLRILRQKIQEDNDKSRSGFSRMFHGGLYSDKQQDVERKKKEEKERRGEKYNRYLAQMMSKNSELGSDEEHEEPLTFEEWEKREIEVEKEQEREKSRGETERRAKESSEKRQTTIISNKNSSDEVELDDEDLRILEETKKMGYCYFKRELTEQEKELNKQFTPTLINGKDSNQGCPQDPNEGLPNSEVDKSRTGISSWNSKGTTFEDKDVSESATSTLKRILTQKDSTFSGMLPDTDSPISISVESIESISGEASVAMIRGTRRFLFDFAVTLNCFYLFEENGERYSFSVSIPSLTSMCNDDDIFGIKDCSIDFTGKHEHTRDIDKVKGYILNQFCLVHLRSRVNLLISEINSQY